MEHKNLALANLNLEELETLRADWVRQYETSELESEVLELDRLIDAANEHIVALGGDRR